MSDTMYPRVGSCSVLLIFLLFALLPPVSSVPSGRNVTYSLVHLSDTQNLDTRFPDSYNLTFSYLDSLKESENITAIIITGDLVNTGNSRSEWDTYSRARNHTSIPVFTIAGNHDTNYGKNYDQYSFHTNEPEVNYVSSIGDLDFIGINYMDTSFPADEFSRLRANLTRSSRTFAIIATHYYMDKDGKLSPLGEDIDRNLIVKPSLVLMGHMHADFIKQRTVGGFPVIADMTNYQDGVPGGITGMNYSAGTLYTITSVNGQTETITARVIHISPSPSFEEGMTVFSRDSAHPLPADSTPVNGTPASAVSICSTDSLFSILNGFFQQFQTIHPAFRRMSNDSCRKGFPFRVQRTSFDRSVRDNIKIQPRTDPSDPNDRFRGIFTGYRG
jgi:predicted MPP superfamily phosphohydrolase